MADELEQGKDKLAEQSARLNAADAAAGASRSMAERRLEAEVSAASVTAAPAVVDEGPDEPLDPNWTPPPSKRKGKPIDEDTSQGDEIADPTKRQWYILNVQSNREDSVRRNLIRKIRIADKEAYFGDIVVPTENVTEVRNGKKKVIRRKLYPGYVMVNMELNEETLFLIRDTTGIGNFTGSGGKPVAMEPHEVERILAKQEDRGNTAPKLQIAFKEGDRVKINEGTFHDIEGEVESIDHSSGRVMVTIQIFGRSTPVEFEYWQVEAV